ncbi:hypothetical protein AB0K60_18430 [Thermopolyspora sp. NPDC052614]
MPHTRRVAPQQVSLVLLGHAFLAMEATPTEPAEIPGPTTAGP